MGRYYRPHNPIFNGLTTLNAKLFQLFSTTHKRINSSTYQLSAPPLEGLGRYQLTLSVPCIFRILQYYQISVPLYDYCIA